MENVKEIMQIIFAWPIVSIIGLIILRKPLFLLVNRFIKSDQGNAKIGPVEIRFGKVVEDGEKAVSNLKQINILMAESRLLELKITQKIISQGMHSGVIDRTFQEEMQTHIEKFKELTKDRTN